MSLTRRSNESLGQYKIRVLKVYMDQQIDLDELQRIARETNAAEEMEDERFVIVHLLFLK